MEISASRSLDVLEIDGASNRGIDEIRSLRENVKFAPAQGKFKIYIIDEVHMLTQEAFNALLKTLEEPPKHVKFIFATTQPNKVLATILSRCQKFDFRKIPTKDIVGKLTAISKEEKLKVTEDALYAIARAADGSLRDTESILDQLSSFSGRKIALSDVTQVLGSLSEDTLFEMAEAISAGDPPGVLKTIDSLIKDGKDISSVAIELMEYFRNLLIAKVGKDLKELIDLPEESIKRLSEQSGKFSIEDLIYALNVIASSQEMARRSNMTRVPLEMAVIKLSKKESIRSLGEILDRIDDLEKGVTNVRDEEPPVRKPQPKPQAKKPKEDPPPQKKEEDPPQVNKNTSSNIELGQIEDIWPNVIRNVKAKKISIASCLMEGEVVSCRGNAVVLGFPKGQSFHREVVERAQNKKVIEEALREIMGEDLILEFTTIEERQKPSSIGLSEVYEDDISVPDDSPPDPEALKDPIVGSAVDIFKGKVVNSKRQRS